MKRSIPVVLTALGALAPTVALPAEAIAASTLYAGTGYQYPYGTLQVKISVAKKKLTGVSVSYAPDTPHSAQLQQYAIPMLKQEALKAKGYKIHGISGVTITSEVFDQSLYSAMVKAHIA